MADQAAVMIDANLLVNSARQGAADAWNYGPQAVEARNANIDAVTQATDFNYGTQARDLRGQETKRLNAAADFNYGTTAQQIQGEDLTQKVLQNDLQNMENVKRKADGEAVDGIVRQSKVYVESSKLEQNKKQYEFFTGAEGQTILQESSANAARQAGEKALLGYKQAQTEVAVQDAKTRQELAVASRTALQAQRESAQYEKSAKFHDNFTSVLEADSTETAAGNPKPTNTINLLSKSLLGDRQAVMDNADEVLNWVNQQDIHDLPIEAKKAVEDIQRVARYASSGKQITSTISGVASRVASGQGTAQDVALNAVFSSVGLNSNDTHDMLGVSVDKVPGGYQVYNPTLDRRSRLITDDEFAANQDLQNVYVQSIHRNKNSNNSANAFGNAQNLLDSTFGSPLGAQGVKTVNGILSTVVGGDKEKIATQAVDIAQSLRTQSLGANEWLVKMEEYDQPDPNQGLISSLITPNASKVLTATSWLAEDLDPVEVRERLARAEDPLLRDYASPAFAENVIASFQNRRYGGLDSSVLEVNVEEHVNNIIRNTPAYNKLSGQAYADMKRRVTNQVKANVIVPISDSRFRDVLPLVVKAHPQFNTPDVQEFLTGKASTNKTVGQYLGSIKELIYGGTVSSDLSKNSKAVGEVLATP